MERLCPLCQKMGVVSKLSNYPLNESEDIEMCENEKCVWPFGYEPFKFIPKIDEDLKEIMETSKNLPVIPISTELSLYTPPVTPVDNQEAKTDVKGITDSYASPATIVKDIQVSSNPSPSIFDIDSPEKALTSRSIQGCDKKLVFISNFSGVGAKKKSLPTVTNTETVTSMRILKKVPMKKMVLKKVIKPVINNVNMSMVPFNYGSSLEMPNNSSVSENKLDTGVLGVKDEDKLDKNFPLDLPDISFDESFIKQDNNFESIIPELDSGDLSQQMDVDEWLNSLIL